MRIVQVANFHAPTSGGIRVALASIGAGYTAAGHERILVVPGPAHGRNDDAGGVVVQVPGVRLRGTPYRCIVERRPLAQLLERLRPDAVEVSDKSTLRWVGRWAREAGVPSVLFSHERIDAALAPRLPPGAPLGPVARRWNRRWADAFDAVVCASQFAVDEFRDVGVEPHLVPLGVDLDRFRPLPRPPADGTLRLVVVSRLSAEKQVDVAVGATRRLAETSRRVQLDVAGSGPGLRQLRRLAGGLPVCFHGHRPAADVAQLLAGADVAIAPGPAETFGLAALEALACGTPVVVRREGACAELITPTSGATCSGSVDDMAAAVEQVAGLDPRLARPAARRRAERYDWGNTVTGLLRVHQGLAVTPARG